MRIVRQYVASAIALFAVALIGCGASKDNSLAAPQPRPANVPREAVWLGGSDGGVFVRIKQDKVDPSNIYSAEIYFGSTGEVWYKGRLSMKPSEKPKFDYKNVDSYAGWDGDTLYLKDGRVLKAIDSKQ
jgi:hypothetical protein